MKNPKRFLRKAFLYSLCTLLTVFCLATATYKVAWLLSCYPNDWFLDYHAFAPDKDIEIKQSFNSYFICKKDLSIALKPYLKNYHHHLDYSVRNLSVKKGRTVHQIKLDNGQCYVLKRYLSPSFWMWLRRCTLRTSEAYHSFYYAKMLEKNKIASPEAIAVFERRIGPFWIESYLVTEFIPGMHPGGLVIKNRLDDFEETVAQLQEDLEKLKELHYIHADYSFRNILVVDRKAYLIDLDDIHFHQFNNIFFQKRFERKHFKRLQQDIEKSLQILNDE